jgi:N-acetylglucosaminyl-diphospho-decaprenol L-rhamnosyltransferase
MGPDPASQVDVVVVSYNSSGHLRSCVEPISRSKRCNVIVVDNASTDGAAATVVDLPISLVAEPSNRGFAAGCNRGWRLGDAVSVLFLNPDCRIETDGIDALAAVLARDPAVGVVGPRIVGSDGRLSLSQFRFPRVRYTLSESVYLHRLWPRSSWSSDTVREPAAYEEPCDAEWLSGACLMVRRELLEKIGGFDESFFMYSEDTELCRAAWAEGYSVRFDPAVSVKHIGGASASRAGLLPTMTRSRIRYATRNYSRPIAFAHRVGLAFQALTHAMLGGGGWAGRRGNMTALAVALSEPASKLDQTPDRHGQPRDGSPSV